MPLPVGETAGRSPPASTCNSTVGRAMQDEHGQQPLTELLTTELQPGE